MKPIVCKGENKSKYLVSPYNFIGLPFKGVYPYKSFKELPRHDNYKEGNGLKLLSGFIDYKIEAKTPIMIESGDKDEKNREAYFFKNLEGKYAIPGNSFRGLIRSNSQILSFSPVVAGEYSEIEDNQFLYRDIASTSQLSKRYKEVLGTNDRGISRNLKAGYIYKKSGSYYIRESEKIDRDYAYVDLKELKLHKGLGLDFEENNLMYSKDILDSEKRINDLNKKRRSKNFILKDKENKNFKPYFKELSFDYDKKKRNVTRLGQPGQCQYDGYILSSNYILGKMKHYIVPAPLEDMGEVKLEEKVIDAYLNDMVMTKKADKTSRGIGVKEEFSYYALPKEGEVKPVFYINNREGFHFGFTPNLRIMHSSSVLDGISENYKNPEGISYTDSIFGFTNRSLPEEESVSYKGRLSFTDAVADRAEIDKEASIELILANPKPTSFNMYIRQTDDEMKLYEGDFEIGGFKRYWLKDYIEDPKLEDANKNMAFIINPLKVGTVFKGRIYFENLREDELGLVLLSMRLEEGSSQNIGLAKPYGFGRIEISDIDLNIEDLDMKYKNFSFAYHKKASIDTYIDRFKANFSEKHLDGRELDKEKHIREFYKISSKVVSKDKCQYYRYMSMQDKEFDKKTYLPSILEYETMQKKSTGPSGSNDSRKGGRNKNKNENKNKKKGRGSFEEKADPRWAKLGKLKLD